MNRLFQYIEENMPDDLNNDILTGVGYISCAQLYRDFYSLTGHSVKEYIRRRRLSNALALIKMSEISMTDIALSCGYSSHQALCRAVKQSLGITPSEYKTGENYYYFPKMDFLPVPSEYFASQNTAPSSRPVAPKVDFLPVPSISVSRESLPRVLRVLFYHPSINMENTAIAAFLSAFPHYRGRIFGRNGEQKDKLHCYELYLTETGMDYNVLEQNNFIPAGEIPEIKSLFATVTVRNDADKINAAWDYLYSEWLQKSMFEYSQKPYLEEYIIKNNRPVKLKLYLPIQKRMDEVKITLIKNPGLRFVVSGEKGPNAERKASQRVIDFLKMNHPHILFVSKEFYLQKNLNSCVCGVQIHSALHTKPNGYAIGTLTTIHKNYLMLESRVTGNYGLYTELLLHFARNNGLNADKNGIFAVYDAKENFENPRIKMYCPIIKNDKK